MQRSPQARADASYSSGFARNVEALLGPFFLIFGGFMVVVIFATYPEALRMQAHLHQPAPPSPYPFLVFPILGLIFCYLAFVRSVSCVEIRGKTLLWFGPFHRFKGQAPIADIVYLWTGSSLSWRVTRTVFVIEHRPQVSIRDRNGIKEFVAELSARSPEILLEDWEPRAGPTLYRPISSSAPIVDDVVARRVRAEQLRRSVPQTGKPAQRD